MHKLRILLAAALLGFPQVAFAQVAGDPQGSGPIVAALGWLQGTLLGNVATAVAVMAVAAVIRPVLFQITESILHLLLAIVFHTWV